MGDNRPGGVVAAASESFFFFLAKISLSKKCSLSKVCVGLCDRAASAGAKGIRGR